jgi:integrase
MTVNLYLDNTSSAIMLVVQHQGKKFRMSTREIIKPANHWDSTNQRVKSSYKNYEEINSKIKAKKSLAEKAIRDYEILHGQLPSLNHLKNTLQHQSLDNYKTFPKLVEAFVQHYKDHKSKSSHEGVLNFRNRILDFQKVKKIELTFDNIDATTINLFKSYLEGDRKQGVGTVKRNIVFLGTMLNFGIDNGYLKTYQTRLLKFKRQETNVGDKIFLTLEEVSKLEKITGLEKKLEKVKDAFLFQCYTGLRYSDIINLKPANITDQYITVVVQKTKKRIVIPITAKARAILDKYEGKTKNGRCLPAYNPVAQNAFLKKLGKIAKLDKIVQIVNFVGNARKEVNKHTWELLTTHTGRRTFATNFILKGGSIVQLSSLLGHSDIRTTQIYLRHTPEMSAETSKEFML